MRVCVPARSPVGWNCTISMSRSGSPARSAMASPSHDLSPEGVWYLYIVGPPPVARITARARTRTGSPVRMSISSTAAMRAPSHERISSIARCSSSRRTPRAHLLGEPVDDLDPGEIAFVDGAVERLAGERLLMQGAVGIAVEETADLVLELVHPLDRARDELPGEILIG